MRLLQKSTVSTEENETLHGGIKKFIGTSKSFFRSFISFFRSFISALRGEFSFARELLEKSSVGETYSDSPTCNGCRDARSVRPLDQMLQRLL